MAYQPGYSGLLNAAMPKIGQYEAATGRRINKQFIQGLLAADLEKSKQLAMQDYWRQREMNIAQQRTDIMQQQANAQRRAEQVSGYGQIAQLPIAYQAGKKALTDAGIISSAPQAPAATGTTTTGLVAPTTATAPAAYSGSYGGPSLLSGGTAGTAQGAIGAAGTTAGAQTVPMAAAPAYSGAGTGGVTYGSVAGEMGGGLGAGAGADMGMGVGMGTTGLAGAGGALAGKTVGHYIAKPLGVNEKSAERYGAIAGGAAMGFAAAGPIGAVVGGAIGFVSSLF